MFCKDSCFVRPKRVRLHRGIDKNKKKCKQAKQSEVSHENRRLTVIIFWVLLYWYLVSIFCHVNMSKFRGGFINGVVCKISKSVFMCCKCVQKSKLYGTQKIKLEMTKHIWSAWAIEIQDVGPM